jgi:hypothetical protein
VPVLPISNRLAGAAGDEMRFCPVSEFAPEQLWPGGSGTLFGLP